MRFVARGWAFVPVTSDAPPLPFGSEAVRRENSLGRGEICMAGIRRVATIVLGLLVACSGGGKTFATGEVESLLLRPSEAPAGTTYVGQASGPAGLEVFSQGIEQAQERFAQLGFQGGYTAIFSSPDGSITIGSGALVFKDADAASEALEVQRSIVVPNATVGSMFLVPGSGTSVQPEALLALAREIASRAEG